MANHSDTTIMRKAIFPGSFDPFTIGHADIVSRGLALFDHIVIAIGVNIAKADAPEYAKRLHTIQDLYGDNPNVSVVTYNGLTVDCARQQGAYAILRGVRSVKDYEYERNMADINRQIADIDTVLLFCSPQLAAVSSSTVRELQRFGKDITPFLPSNPHNSKD